MNDVQGKNIDIGPNRPTMGVFGRDEEQGVIRLATKKLLEGNKVYLEITGEAGVGKSFVKQKVLSEFSNIRIVRSIYRPGSQYRPYQVVNSLYEQLLESLKQEKSYAEFSKWLEGIDSITENLTRDIISSIPFVKDIVKKEKKADQGVLSPAISKNLVENFYINFSKELFKEIGDKTLLVIDNLQYFDESSLELIFRIFNNIDSSLMLILSGTKGEWQQLRKDYLTNSPGKHPMEFLVDFKNYTKDEVEKFISFSLGTRVERVSELAELFFETTGGNPKNIFETERKLIREKNLFFDEEQKVWNWEIDTNLFKSKMSIVSMFVNKYDKMDGGKKELLEFCVCLGESINPALLAKLTDYDLEKTKKMLSYFWDEGFMDEEVLSTQQGNASVENYYFSSEDVAEAIHSHVNKNTCKQHHRKIANYFIKRSAVGVADRDVFEAATHLNFSSDIEVQEDDRLLYTTVNARAAKKSRLLASFKAGYEFVKYGVLYSQGLSWEKDRGVLTDLYQEAYQLARLNTDTKTASEFYKMGTEYFDREGLYHLRFNKMVLDIQFGLLNESLETGIKILNTLDFRTSSSANMVSVMIEFLKVKRMLRNKTIDEIYSLPEIKDIRLERIYQVIFWMYRASQYIAPTLNGVLALKQLQLTLKYGSNGESWSGLMAYGVIIGAGMNDYETAFEYSNLGARLAEKYGNDSGKVTFGKAIYWPFKYPLSETIELFERSKEKQCREGDYIGAAEATVNESLTYISLGGGLDEIIGKVQDNYNFCNSVSALDFKDFQRMLLLNLNYLKTGTKSAKDSVELKRITKSTEFNMVRSVDLIMNIMISFLKEDYKEAEKRIKEGKKLVDNLTGLYFKTEFSYFEVLTYLTKTKLEGGNVFLKRRIKKLISNFEKWSRSAPANYEHKLNLIKGVDYLVAGKFKEAESAFIKAIELSEDQGNYMIKAYALKGLERVAKYSSHPDTEQEYHEASKESFRKWGLEWK